MKKSFKIIFCLALSSLLIGCSSSSDNALENLKNSLESLQSEVSENDDTAENVEDSQASGDENATDDSEEDESSEQSDEDSTSNSSDVYSNSTYNFYENARYGFSIEYPSFFTDLIESDNGDGITLTSEDSTVSLRAWGETNLYSQTVEELYNEEVSSDSSITYKSLMSSSYVVSGLTDNNEIYYKCVKVGTSNINTFIITYPEDLSTEFNDIVTEIYSSFTPGNLS